jgi:DNA-binding transcriptional MerR regulator
MRATSPDPAPMKKSPDAFRTISEVADTLDVPAHVLRFWESKFPQIRPVKRGGGRRYYRPDDISLLKGIRELLYTDGLTIKGVQKVLRDQGSKSVAAGAQDDAPSVAILPADQPNLFATPEPEPEPLKLQQPVPEKPAMAFIDATKRKELAMVVQQLEALRDSMRN